MDGSPIRGKGFFGTVAHEPAAHPQIMERWSRRPPRFEEAVAQASRLCGAPELQELFPAGEKQRIFG